MEDDMKSPNKVWRKMQGVEEVIKSFQKKWGLSQGCKMSKS